MRSFLAGYAKLLGLIVFVWFWTVVIEFVVGDWLRLDLVVDVAFVAAVIGYPLWWKLW